MDADGKACDAPCARVMRMNAADGRAARLRAGRAAPSTMRKLSRPKSCVMAQKRAGVLRVLIPTRRACSQRSCYPDQKWNLRREASSARPRKACCPNVVWGLRAHQSLLRTHTASVESLERYPKRHGADLATDAQMQTTSGGYLLRGWMTCLIDFQSSTLP